MLEEVSLGDKINASTTIIEGRVLSKRSFWDDNHDNIFTANTLEVTKVFLGDTRVTQLELLTRGGVVGFDAQSDRPSLQVEVGDVGIFFLYDNQEKITQNEVSGIEVLQPAMGAQGLIEYNLNTGIANAPFQVYPNINEVYALIENQLGNKLQSIQPFTLEKRTISGSRFSASITSFSPGTVTAGTKTQLTINGSGFGAAQGNGFVSFSNADDGGASIDANPLSTEYVSWSDNQIVVEVTEDAGTGNFTVTPDGGVAATSPSSLTVSYAQLNATFGGNRYQTQHIDDDGNGGYTWLFNENFDASTAYLRFKDALETWCNATNIYWTIGGTSSINSSLSDGTNIISFDFASPLPGGTLGRTSNRWTSCNGTDWWVSEVDMLFNDDFSWYYGTGSPGGSEYDFQSVATHEIGHAHQLGHIIEASATVMHFQSFQGATRRVLQATEDTGADDVYTRSTTTSFCSQTSMSTGINCSMLPVELSSFSGYAAQTGNIIEWSTVSETNVKSHIIERSPDGRDNFEVIATKEGAMHSHLPIHYKIEDNAPLPIGYYRLITEDFDGTKEVFNTIAIERDDYQMDIEMITPNPFQNFIDVTFISSETDNVVYEIWNSTGQLVQNGILQSHKGINQQQIETAQLPSGIYVFTIVTQQGKKVYKLVKS
jgi:hypothetical protein